MESDKIIKLKTLKNTLIKILNNTNKKDYFLKSVINKYINDIDKIIERRKEMNLD